MTTELWLVGGIYTFLFFMLFIAGMFFKYRHRIFRGKLRVRVLSDLGKEKSYVIKNAAQDGEKFQLTAFGRKRTFEIHRSALIMTGPEEMPTLEYNAFDAAPIARGKEDRQVSSIRFREVAENTVMRDLLESFKKKVIDSATALIITVIVVLLTGFVLGIFINDKLTKISDRLPQQTTELNTGTPLE